MVMQYQKLDLWHDDAGRFLDGAERSILRIWAYPPLVPMKALRDYVVVAFRICSSCERSPTVKETSSGLRHL
jgi:hypothetical protein